MKIIIVGEVFGVIRDAFQKAGHEAISCDLNPTRVPGKHIQSDWRNIRNISDFDLLIGHPVCRYLCNSGVQYLHKEIGRYAMMLYDANNFKELLEAPVKRMCIENPVMHGYAYKAIGEKWTQTFHPHYFGDDASKRTCLWLKNLPLLKRTHWIIKKRYANQAPCGSDKRGPHPDRSMQRAKTYPGVAKAMVEQWGGLGPA